MVRACSVAQEVLHLGVTYVQIDKLDQELYRRLLVPAERRPRQAGFEVIYNHLPLLTCKIQRRNGLPCLDSDHLSCPTAKVTETGSSHLVSLERPL